jgi:site-specific DNA recombinase
VKLVIVTKLDRLGRTARVLLEAHDDLAGCGVAIASATEPFDTRTSIGRFLFQLLASIAELERETIRERSTLGRDRIAREGKFVNGPVPFGYAVDDGGFLVASDRQVPELGISEAELVRELFRRVADGDTSVRLALWLKAAGVRPTRRYFSRKTRRERERQDAVTWSPGRVCRTIGNPVYRGVHTIRSAHGDVERAVVPLVAAAVWDRANAQLKRNQEQAFGGGRPDSFYLLRQLIVCENSGRRYIGQAQSRTLRMRLYRCAGTTERCPACSVLAAVRLDRCRPMLLNG